MLTQSISPQMQLPSRPLMPRCSGGQFTLSSDGFQKFTVDPMTGTADVDSLFVGNDLPDPFNPGMFFEYELYNTDTTGTITENTSGCF